MHPSNHIFDHTLDSLTEWCAARSMPAFRATQILEWVYRRGVVDPAAMSNLSKRDRETLAREMTFLSGDALAHQIATDGTQKLLVQWTDYRSDKATERPSDEGETPRTRSASECDSGQAGDAPAAEIRDAALAGATSPHTPTSADAHAASTSAPSRPLDPRTRLTILSPTLPMPDTTRQTECVMIPSDDPEGIAPPRRTACISSQVGCPVGCRFCASGLGGLDANLSAGRIVEQVWRLRAILGDSGLQPGLGGSGLQPEFGGSGLQPESGSQSRPIATARGLPGGRSALRAEHGLKSRATAERRATDELPRITNIVFMGMGEPLSNFRAVTSAIRTIAAVWGHAISARKITISTVGMPRAIERLAEEFDLPVTLALSLHAPTDEIRRSLIPWAEYSTIQQLLGACQKWFEKTGREITLEYTLLAGVNDRPEHAAELARLAKTLRANINLIRYNEVAGMPFSRPATSDVRAFQEALRAKGVNAHIRASRGRDIAAACGQLRHEAAGATP